MKPFLFFALMLATARLYAADSFPDFSQLPSRPEIPDPLAMLNGTKVTSKSQWLRKRRPELKALFEHYMYGTMPPAPRRIHFDVERVDHSLFGGKATKKEVTIRFSDDTNAPMLHLLEVIPNTRKDRRGFPVFVGLNFCGNHTVLTNGDIALPVDWLPKNCPGCVDGRATDAGRGAQTGIWNIEQTIDRGYAVATAYCGDIQPDDPDATTGLRAFLARQAAIKKQKPGDCATIAAWAWGLSRCADYLVKDRDIDAKRIAVVGHSRLGKTAVLAAAMDERFALAIPLQAGCGGTAPSRGTVGESVTAINTHFPHWFNDEFKKFNDHPDRIPFDQNCLIAMVAPRPVLLGQATGDQWANPKGAYEMLQSADSVYRLFGKVGIDSKPMPAENQLVGDHLGYFIRPGKHSMTKPDWQVFLDYADRMMP